jgi:HEXXH motif-containing protein
LTSYHTLPSWLASSLSGAGDGAEIEFLHAGQISRRLVQLRVILDLAQRNAPQDCETAELHANFAALAQVQRHDPRTVAALLSGPQVGAWAARCVRLLNGEVSAIPLWVHLAHLGSIAVTDAVQTGVHIKAQVPVRAGVVSLPTLGRALLDRSEPWGLAVCTSGTPMLLDGSPPLRWSPIPLLETDTLSILLDNVDPYWDCFGIPVRGAMDEPTIERWRRQFAEAWGIIARRHGHRRAVLTKAIRCLVPLEQDGRFGGASASSRSAPGAVALTEPAGPDRLAATLVHEMQHFRLYALQDLVPLHRDAGESLYSPWRNDPRGLSGLLHATTAFLGVADFWGRERPVAGRGAELMYARTVRQLHIGCQIVNSQPNLTEVGQALVEALAAAVDRLPLLGIDEEMSQLVTDLVAHHQALWRLRNVIPHAADIVVAEKWLLGAQAVALAAPADRITHATAPGGDSPLFRLAVAWAENPEQVRVDAANSDVFAARYPGADVADLPLLAGEYAEALALRLSQIAEGAVDAETWASLSVAHGRLSSEPESSPLVARPEVVRAAWTNVAGADWDPQKRLSN